MVEATDPKSSGVSKGLLAAEVLCFQASRAGAGGSQREYSFPETLGGGNLRNQVHVQKHLHAGVLGAVFEEVVG